MWSRQVGQAQCPASLMLALSCVALSASALLPRGFGCQQAGQDGRLAAAFASFGDACASSAQRRSVAIA
eukprot:6187675-Pleurochrysis_carterae.AAC.2